MFKVWHTHPSSNVYPDCGVFWFFRLILGSNLETGHDHILTLPCCLSFAIILLYLNHQQEIFTAVETITVSLLYHLQECDITCMYGACIVCKFVQLSSLFNDRP
jgi:hypothetical protein